MHNGTLELTLVAARDLKSKDGMFGSNDPYVVVRLGNQRFKTEVIKKAGKQCQWNHTFKLGVTDKMNDISIEVYDEDNLSDDLIGKTDIPLQGIFQAGYVDSWYTIGKGSKTYGEVHATIRFIPGSFPQGFDPNATNVDDGIKLAGGVVGGALAAAALGFAGKKMYDHHKNKDVHEQEHQQSNIDYGSGVPIRGMSGLGSVPIESHGHNQECTRKDMGALGNPSIGGHGHSQRSTEQDMSGGLGNIPVSHDYSQSGTRQGMGALGHTSIDDQKHGHGGIGQGINTLGNTSIGDHKHSHGLGQGMDALGHTSIDDHKLNQGGLGQGMGALGHTSSIDDNKHSLGGTGQGMGALGNTSIGDKHSHGLGQGIGALGHTSSIDDNKHSLGGTGQGIGALGNTSIGDHKHSMGSTGYGQSQGLSSGGYGQHPTSNISSSGGMYNQQPSLAGHGLPHGSSDFNQPSHQGGYNQHQLPGGNHHQSQGPLEGFNRHSGPGGFGQREVHQSGGY